MAKWVYARVHVLALSAPPVDPFSRSQSTPEPPASPREPLKSKDVAKEWNVATFEHHLQTSEKHVH